MEQIPMTHYPFQSQKGLQQPPPPPQGQPMLMMTSTGTVGILPQQNHGIYACYLEDGHVPGPGEFIPMIPVGSRCAPPPGGLGGGQAQGQQVFYYNQQTAFPFPPVDPSLFEEGFTERSTRRRFLCKVYSILITQMLLSFGILLLILFYLDRVLVFLYDRTPTIRMVFIFGMPVACLTIFFIGYCESFQRKSPLNLLCLVIFTLCKLWIFAWIAFTYKIDFVLGALAVTSLVCMALALFSLLVDFKTFGGILFVVLITFLLCGGIILLTASSFLHVFPILSIVYACIPPMIFAMWLVYDTQRMVRGEHRCIISHEEYIFAALNVYMDVARLFIICCKNWPRNSTPRMEPVQVVHAMV